MLRQAAVLLAAATALAVLPAVSGSAAVRGSAAEAAPPVLVVAPRDGGVVAAGAALDVDIAVTNDGTVPLAPGTVRFSLEKQPVASAQTLLDGIAHPPAELLGILLPVTARTGAVAPGGTARVRVRVPAAAVDSVLSSESGTRILYARLDVGVAAVVAESAVTRMAKGFAGRVGLGALLPLTAPANSTGVVDVATQDRLTVSGGAWDDVLRAARADPGATIALDPEVAASIRLAGSAASPGTAAFLTALAALPNPFVELPYADADLTLERAAGVAGDLTPATFAGASTAAVAGGGSTASPAPTAAPTAGTASAPDRTALLRWNWSGHALAWPVRGSVTAADPAELAADGRTVLLAASDVRDTAARVAGGPAARIGSRPVLVADTPASALLGRAGTPGSAGSAALAQLVGVLATDAVTRAVPAVLAVPDRGRDLGALEHAMAVLRAQPWIAHRTLDALARGSAPVVKLAAPAQSPSRVATAQRLIDGEAAVRDLGGAMPNAGPLIGPERLALLGMLSASWRLDESAWNAAAADGVTRFRAFVDQVRVNRSSPFLYTGDSSTLPVNVINDLPEPVTVVVRGTASNGRLRVTGDGVRITVPANGGNKAKLPVKSITNGRVTVAVRLFTPDGAAIGGEATQEITVRAGFEVIVAVVLIAALGLLFLTGVYRNITRQRRRRGGTAAA